MNSAFLPGTPPIPLVLRRSGRAKRISLRVSQLDGRVTLTLPHRVPLREGMAFAREKEAWLRKMLTERGSDIVIGVGAEVPIFGQPHIVTPGDGRRVRVAEGRVFVPGPPDRVGVRLGRHLKETARARLAAASDHYAAKLGKPYAAITIRDTRSRWGSCTAQGRLMYSWRLILAPPEVLDYVAAHEVAHLQEMNHSSAFWSAVASIHGPYDTPRRWLRRNGSDLHRYRFG